MANCRMFNVVSMVIWPISEDFAAFWTSEGTFFGAFRGRCEGGNRSVQSRKAKSQKRGRQEGGVSSTRISGKGSRLLAGSSFRFQSILSIRFQRQDRCRKAYLPGYLGYGYPLG